MLPKGIITHIAEKAADGLIKSGAARGERQTLLHAIERAITEELEVEKNLREEADKILEQNLKAARASGADLGTLREKIVRQLARDKGVVLK